MKPTTPAHMYVVIILIPRYVLFLMHVVIMWLGSLYPTSSDINTNIFITYNHVW